MNKLAGKVAIVTGASKGIGAAAAKALAAEGAAVAVNYSSGKEGAEGIVAQITREGGKAIAIQADVSKASDVKRMFEATKKALGSVDVLVNTPASFSLIRWRPLLKKSSIASSISTCSGRFSRRRKRSSISHAPAAASSISARSQAPTRCRIPRSTPAPRARSIQSRWRWRKSSDRETSGSMS